MIEFGAPAPARADEPVLLVHGLAGHAGEWDAVVSGAPGLDGWALDLRGHGQSTRRPARVGRDAMADDLACVVDRLAGRPVRIVGQSLGGALGVRLAARRPDLVAALVVIDAGPTAPRPEQAAQVRAALRGWPTPFPRFEDAVAFFGGGERGHAWARGLTLSPEGWRARFDLDVIEAMASADHDDWDSWDAIRGPTTVLRAGRGSYVTDADAERMRRTGPRATVRTVPGAGHDLHLDDPHAVSRALGEEPRQPRR